MKKPSNSPKSAAIETLEDSPSLSELSELVIKTMTLTKQENMLISGPLPSPETLKGYNDILPGAAERVFKMAEKSQEQYLFLDNKINESDIQKSRIGQYFAFIICLIGFGSALTCVFINPIAAPVIGPILGGATLIGLVPFFLGIKKDKEAEERIKKERKKKPSAA